MVIELTGTVRIAFSKLLFAILLICGLSHPSLAQQLRSNDFPDIANKISTGDPFQFSDVSYLFTGGVAYELLSNCSVAANGTAKSEVATFAYAAAQRAMLGNQYSNPNLAETLGSQAGGQAVFVAGGLSARAFNCDGAGQIIEHIGHIVRSNRGDGGGATAAFVSSCSPIHGKTSCECLARLGSAVYPNIYQKSYSREIVRGIIEGNPLLGFQIMACGISNY